MALLEVKDLHVDFRTERGVVSALRGVSMSLEAGEMVGLVGESGCGKSVTARAIMRLLPTPPAQIPQGEVVFQGRDLLSLSKRQMRSVRGGQIGMIFQDPMTSLNPVLSVGFQIEEVIKLHRPSLSRKQRRELALEMLDKVRIPSPKQRIKEYPHQLSGGMRQRVMIAMALVCEPALLIADEPTTALDVTVQAQILELMRTLKEETGAAILLITHDLGVVAEVCDRVMVMYLGQVVEQASVEALFSAPRHPYTHGLMASIPRLQEERQAGERLAVIEGVVPSLDQRPEGCAFHARCRYAQERCLQEPPPLRAEAPLSPTHPARCWFPLTEGGEASPQKGGDDDAS